MSDPGPLKKKRVVVRDAPVESEPVQPAAATGHDCANCGHPESSHVSYMKTCVYPLTAQTPCGCVYVSPAEPEIDPGVVKLNGDNTNKVCMVLREDRTPCGSFSVVRFPVHFGGGQINVYVCGIHSKHIGNLGWSNDFTGNTATPPMGPPGPTGPTGPVSPMAVSDVFDTLFRQNNEPTPEKKPSDIQPDSQKSGFKKFFDRDWS